jgi:MYXO-CTERM domain-containing protein
MYYTGAIARMENAVDIKNADGLLIFGNVMYGFSQNKTIVAQKGPRGIDVRCNEMHTGFTGVEFRGEDGGTIEDVTFARNVMHGFSEYALKFDGVADAAVFNNTFVDVASDGLRLEGAGLTGGIVRNNLWVSTGAIDAAPGVTADHNGFFMTGSVGIASPTDVNADPMLTMFELSAGSPMIDAGVDVGFEFAGAAPDIGRHEVGLDLCGDTGAGGGPSGATTSAGATGVTTGAGGPGATGAGGATSGGAGGGAEDGEDDGCDCHATRGDGGPRGLAMLLLSVVGLASALRRRRARRP